MAFIPNFNPTSYSPDVEALYYTEHRRKDGHPDANYSALKFKEMDIEEQGMNELIKQALNRMNQHYRRKHTQPIDYPVQSSNTVYSGEEPERPRNHKPSFKKPSFSFHIDWRTKNLLKSLKFWFVVFWANVGVLYLLEGNNPTSFYNSIPEAVKYVFYIFAAGISGWIGYWLFEKLDSSHTSDRGVFALRIKSGILTLIGLFLVVYSVIVSIGIYGPFLSFTLSIGRTTISVFFGVLGLAFLMVGGYLMFKFERRSGIIVYRR